MLNEATLLDDNQNLEPIKGFKSISLSTKIVIILGGVLILSGITVLVIFLCQRGSSKYTCFSDSNHLLGTLRSLVNDNIGKVKKLEQDKNAGNCKSTAVAQSVSIIMAKNRTASEFEVNPPTDHSCRDISKETYTGSDGKTYKPTYNSDSSAVTAEQQKTAIDSAITNGLPIVVAVHDVRGGKHTKHHWVTIINKCSDSYSIIDPWEGRTGSLKDLNYDFGLSDYSPYHYGFVSFKPTKDSSSYSPPNVQKSDPTQVAETVYKFFTDLAFSKNAVCGMLGNMQAESGLDPNKGQIEGSGYGLVQWTPGTKLKNWATDRDKDYTTTDTQCEKILDEYRNATRGKGEETQYGTSSHCSLTFGQYAVSTKSPEELAECFMYNYERPGVLRLEERKKYAREWYNHFD